MIAYYTFRCYLFLSLFMLFQTMFHNRCYASYADTIITQLEVDANGQNIMLNNNNNNNNNDIKNNNENAKDEGNDTRVLKQKYYDDIQLVPQIISTNPRVT